MKFSEKLQTLRKDMKMSQEDLADMLDVSRQSVSKWESSQTYPEMDKLLELCKIFKCTLDDLTNDEVKEIKKGAKEKNNISNLVDSLLYLIKRSYNMLKKMKLKNIIGCILEMLLVFLIILFFHNIVDYIYELGEQIFVHFGTTASNIICSIWKSLLEIIYIILGVIVFVYIYKIRYLDRYDEIKVVTSDEKENKEDTKKEEKIIIKKESSSGFFDILGNIVLFFIKVFIFFMAIPFIFLLVFLGMCFIISIILLFSGVTYIGINLIILAAIVLTLVFLYLVYYFIFNKKIKVKDTLIVILSSLLLLGVGIGITVLNVANTSFVNDVSAIATSKTKEQTFPMNNNLYIEPDYYKVNYIVDNTLGNNIKVEALYYEKYQNVSINCSDNVIYFDDDYLTKEINKGISKTIIKDLKNKSFHNYTLLFDIKVNVYATSKNIDILKQNYNNYLNSYQEEQNNCDDNISNLEDSLTEKENTISNLEEEKEILKEENQDLKDKIENYKNELSNLINE